MVCAKSTLNQAKAGIYNLYNLTRKAERGDSVDDEN